MPVENFEEESLEVIPDFKLRKLTFLLTCNIPNKDNLRSQIMEIITTNDMAPFYEMMVAELSFRLDNTLMDKMKANNVKRLEELDTEIKNAGQNLGDIEVRDAMIAKAHYLSRIGNKDKALEQFNLILQKKIMIGCKLDLMFHLIRIGFFYNDRKLITDNIEKADTLIEEGGDWDRRNRLKVYKGLYYMSIREFSKASEQFLDAVATFTSYELLDYKTFIVYTVMCCMISLKRADLYDKVVKGPEILEVLHGLPSVKEYVSSLYECRYGDFFRYLAGVENFMKLDRYLCDHYRYYVREMRILSYKQHLESYSNLNTTNMAKLFGVSVGYLDRELSRFIASSRLACKMDQQQGLIETTVPDSVNSRYQSVIKHGDVLLNRIQKLSRVISN